MASIAASNMLSSHVAPTGAQGSSQFRRASSSDTSACLRTPFPTPRHPPARVARVAERGMRQVAVRNTATDARVSAERVEWKDKREVLRKNGVKSVSAKEALAMQKNGYTILDVRPPAEFEEAHPQGALNAAVYRLIKEWTPWDILRRAGFAFFGVFNGTEENPDFVQEVEDLGLKKDGGLIVACAGAGTMKPSTNFPVGKESRSLIAAYALTTKGFKKVVHMEGGLTSWFKEELPVE